MIQSMTGFGKAETSTEEKNINIEIRSLNSKNIDLKTRVPSHYKEKEMLIRKILTERLKRGKVDFSLSVDYIADRPRNSINQNVLLAYISQLKNINPNYDDNQLVAACLRLPDVLKAKDEEIDENEWQNIHETISEAVDKLIAYRKDEGKSLETDLFVRISNIKKLLRKIVKLDQNRIENIKTRLRKAVEQLQTDIDENRFEQELIYYLEKYDINEEKVRLTNHLDYFISEFQNNEEAKGKKLGFITQEMGREINTIGSKANDSDIQQLVVQMKDELEKIKEQVLNVL